MLFVYTDGSVSRPKDGVSPGGWAFCYQKKTKVYSDYGGQLSVTNNHMEMIAAIKAMQHLLQTRHKGKEICIISDSQYVVKGATEYIHTWKENGWRKATWGGRPAKRVANKKLWEQIDYLQQQFKTRWKWIRGHQGNPFNEMVDELAKKGANRACTVEAAKLSKNVSYD